MLYILLRDGKPKVMTHIGHNLSNVCSVSLFHYGTKVEYFVGTVTCIHAKIYYCEASLTPSLKRILMEKHHCITMA